jgi:hypothetical protein
MSEILIHHHVTRDAHHINVVADLGETRWDIPALSFTAHCTCGWKGDKHTPGEDVNNGFRSAKADGAGHQIDASERGV